MDTDAENLEARFNQLTQQLEQKLKEAQKRREEKIESLPQELQQNNAAHFRDRAEEYLAKMEEDIKMGRLDLAKIHQDLAESYLDLVKRL